MLPSNNLFTVIIARKNIIFEIFSPYRVPDPDPYMDPPKVQMRTQIPFGAESQYFWTCRRGDPDPQHWHQDASQPADRRRRENVPKLSEAISAVFMHCCSEARNRIFEGTF